MPPTTFGLYLSTQFAHDDARSRLREARQQVVQARDVGFGSIWLGSHYLTYPMISLQPVPLLASLIPDAGTMTIGTNVLVLPILSPVAVAEESATLNLLANGRYILGVGLGYRDAEFEAFGVDKHERVSRLEEAIGVLRTLAEQRSVTHHGRHYSLTDVGLGGRFESLADVPIYLGGTVDASIARAGRLADGLLMDIYLTLDRLAEQAEIFRRAADEADRPIGEVVVLRECYIGASRGEALDDCRKAIETKYAAYSAWGQDAFLGASDKFDQPLESFVDDRLLIGDKSYVRDEIARYREQVGSQHFVFRVHWPTLPIEAALNSIRVLGEIMTELS